MRNISLISQNSIINDVLYWAGDILNELRTSFFMTCLFCYLHRIIMSRKINKSREVFLLLSNLRVGSQIIFFGSPKRLPTISMECNDIYVKENVLIGRRQNSIEYLNIMTTTVINLWSNVKACHLWLSCISCLLEFFPPASK